MKKYYFSKDITSYLLSFVFIAISYYLLTL
jgi:hypothetical protein